jgi:hypothetical protein
MMNLKDFLGLGLKEIFNDLLALPLRLTHFYQYRESNDIYGIATLFLVQKSWIQSHYFLFYHNCYFMTPKWCFYTFSYLYLFSNNKYCTVQLYYQLLKAFHKDIILIISKFY